MKVKLLKNYASPEGGAWPGEVLDLPTKEAETLVEQGDAIAVQEDTDVTGNPVRADN